MSAAKGFIFTKPEASIYAPSYYRIVRNVKQVGSVGGRPCYRGKAKIDGKQTTVESIGDNSPWYFQNSVFSVWYRTIDGDAVHEKEVGEKEKNRLTGETYIVTTRHIFYGTPLYESRDAADG